MWPSEGSCLLIDVLLVVQCVTGADAVKDALTDASEGAEEFADDFERRASAAANRVEANVAEAGGE